MKKWHNWSRGQHASPHLVLSPSSIAEVIEQVTTAAEHRRRIRAVGAGHSFSAIAVAPQVQLNLSRLRGIVEIDLDRKQVTLAAGTHLYEIPELLAPYGLAMANLGDIDKQTVAGAISTGTHGTGHNLGGIATQVIALKLVTGTGEVVSFSPELTPEIWPAVQLNFGTFGVIVEVTLQLVDAYYLEASESAVSIPEAFELLLSPDSADYRSEFYWFPGTDLAAAKQNRKLPVSPEHYRPRSSFKVWLDDEFIANNVFGAACALVKTVPSLTKTLNRISAGTLANSSFTDLSNKVLTRPRRVRFNEMEYAVPRQALPEVFAEIRELITKNDWRISFPVEVRTAAADNIWMSTAYDRDSGYIAVHRYYREEYQEYFRAVEQICINYQGRPHWGKLHFQSADYFATVYPHFSDFVSLRNRFDPARIFTNDYLDRVLGLN